MALGSLSFDICVIGGGVNGTAIARDAAGRGIRSIVFEKRDLAQETSSSSTKLIHGGLRYLEYYEFGLVRAALQERNIPSQLLVFPNENHWVLNAKNSLQWHNTVFAWLDRWLKPEAKLSE